MNMCNKISGTKIYTWKAEIQVTVKNSTILRVLSYVFNRLNNYIINVIRGLVMLQVVIKI